MYWIKEDLDPIAKELEGVFGPQGRYSDTEPRFFNVCVSSVKYGPLWYGDMDSMEDIADKCSRLKKVSQELSGDTLIVAQITSYSREIARF